MAKIYLISPPYEKIYEKVALKSVGNVVQPPLGLAYIASYLKKQGHSVKLFDAAFSNDLFKEIKTHLDEFKPDFIGISATTPLIAIASKIGGYIKNSYPGIKIILGGPHASALPEETIANHNFDIVVHGEGEITMSEIVENKKLDEIKGICYREYDEIKINPPRPLIDNLDSVPFPLLEQLPLENYYYFFLENSIGILSGRGCPFKCNYCASGVINQHKYRMRSPANFVDELEWIYKKFGITSFVFCDETFTVNRKRVEEICALILERKLPIKWWCTTRVDTLTKEMLKLMKNAGCHSIGIGIESGDKKVLEATRKNIKLEQVEQVVLWAKQLKMRTMGYFILGLPCETPATLEKTLKFSKKLSLFYAAFSMLVPLPGTPIWDMVKEGKVLRCTANNWEDYTRFDKAIIESDSLSADQLTQFHRRIIRSFYFSPNFIFQTLRNVNSFDELVSFSMKGLGLFKNFFLRSR